MNSTIRFVGLLVAVSIYLPLSTASFDFTSFNSSNVGQLQLNPGSSAAQATPVFTSANSGLELLTGVQTNMYDSVFFKTPQDITSFTTTFVIQVIPGSAVSNEADGFVFTLQTTGSSQTTVPDSNGNLIDGGTGLGYAGFPGKSVGVAFNYFAGPTGGLTLGYNIVTNGGNPDQQNGGYKSYSPINLNSGDLIQITITYIGGALYITMQDLSHSTVSFNSVPTSIDIPGTLGANNAYVGFTAAAGADKSKLYLFSWSCGGHGGGHGDPVFSGFQGQEFQFHGLPDEHFNLISSPDVQLNAHFVYLSSGKCDYNDTACYTHPGTYMDILGFSVGETHVKLVSGPHAAGMRVWVDDEEISRGQSRRSLSNHTSASLIFHKHGKVSIHTNMIKFEVANSDMFMNIAVSLANQELLHVGAKKHTVTDEKICKSNTETHNHELIETTVSKKYPMTTPLHGLIGQTWRNVKVCGRDWMGTVQDYVVTSLFGQDYHFNYFQY